MQRTWVGLLVEENSVLGNGERVGGKWGGEGRRGLWKYLCELEEAAAGDGGGSHDGGKEGCEEMVGQVVRGWCL